MKLYIVLVTANGLITIVLLFLPFQISTLTWLFPWVRQVWIPLLLGLTLSTTPASCVSTWVWRTRRTHPVLPTAKSSSPRDQASKCSPGIYQLIIPFLGFFYYKKSAVCIPQEWKRSDFLIREGEMGPPGGISLFLGKKNPPDKRFVPTYVCMQNHVYYFYYFLWLITV